MSEKRGGNSAWAEQHFLVGDDYSTYRLSPNPDGASDRFVDGAVLEYRADPDNEWVSVAYFSAELLPKLARSLLMASMLAEDTAP